MCGGQVRWAAELGSLPAAAGCQVAVSRLTKEVYQHRHIPLCP